MSQGRSPLLKSIPSVLFLLSLLAVLESDTIAQRLTIDAEIARHLKLAAGILAWLSGAALFNQAARWLLWDRVVARAIGGPVPGVLKELASALVYLVSIVCIVGLVFKLSVTGFLAALGASGVVLGFALRNLFADLFTGLAINIDRSFTIGDWVQVNEGAGDPIVARIREIGWRCTLLTTEEQTSVIVPNGMLGLERVVNISNPVEETRFEEKVVVEYSVPSERVKRVLIAALLTLRQQPGFGTSHEPAVLISKTSSLGVEYLLRYWILPWHPVSPTTARDLVLSSVLRHLRTAGISLAYPKADVYHAEMPERQVEGHTAADEMKLLSRIRLFQPLTQDELRRIAETLGRRVFGPGQTLVSAGEQGESLFILIEGLLDVEVERDMAWQHVATLEPGEFFGEMSLLTGERRSATVRARSESVVYEISKQPLEDIMRKRPELGEKLSLILADRQLATRQALEHREEAGDEEAFESFARQLLGRMRDFLGSSRERAAR